MDRGMPGEWKQTEAVGLAQVVAEDAQLPHINSQDNSEYSLPAQMSRVKIMFNPHSCGDIAPAVLQGYVE